MGKLERNNTEEINWLYEYNVYQIQAKLKQSYSALCWQWHYNDVILSAMASQITSCKIVHSTVCAGADQWKRQSSAWLAFVRTIYQWLEDSPYKGLVTWQMFSSQKLWVASIALFHTYKTCRHWPKNIQDRCEIAKGFVTGSSLSQGYGEVMIQTNSVYKWKDKMTTVWCIFGIILWYYWR